MANFIRKHWAAVAVVALLAAMVAVLRLEGRRWFCECEDIRMWIADAYGAHTSQHLFDPYSLTHLLHGLIFYWALKWLVPQWTWQARLFTSTVIEVLWEIIENSPWVIERYRQATAALGYEGDSVVNVVGDVLACTLGFAVARQLGWRGSLALFFAVEIGLLFWIRDNLTLNVVMLFFPIEAIKNWQTAQ
jgi:hypothetical protein